VPGVREGTIGQVIEMQRKSPDKYVFNLTLRSRNQTRFDISSNAQKVPKRTAASRMGFPE